MNEIIKINQGGSDSFIVSSEDNVDFKDFFIRVCEAKVESDREELRLLRKYVSAFSIVYGAKAIAYLCDCIDTEKVIPCKLTPERSSREAEMKSTIVEHFDEVFPQFRLISTEETIKGIGKIDIYAKYNNIPVIIELKAGHRNPNLQLLAYSSQIKDSILIGITDEEFPFKMRLPFINYYTFEQLMCRIFKPDPLLRKEIDSSRLLIKK